MSLPAYPDGPFTVKTLVGGGGGGDFSTCEWVTNGKASVVKKLQVWWNSSYLKAIQVTYSDNSVSRVFGEATELTQTIILAPGEVVTSFVMWGNGIGTRTGRIRLVTNLGQVLDAGKDTSGQTAYTSPTGSGILVGMVGRSGLDIDCLGAVFLDSSVASIVIDNVQYPDSLEGKFTGISPVFLSRSHFFGAEPNGTDWNFSNTVDRTTSSSFSQKSSTMFGTSVNATVTAAGFEIGGSVFSGFRWETTQPTESSTTTSETVNFTWGVSGHLNPGEGVTCTASTEKGVANVQYTSTVTLTLTDGTVSKYAENGVYSNVVYTWAEIKQIPDLGLKPHTPIIEGP
ncbi:MAG: hypothetical protein Q9195_007182 [Heterodermia aff. obscurata]